MKRITVFIFLLWAGTAFGQLDDLSKAVFLINEEQYRHALTQVQDQKSTDPLADLYIGDCYFALGRVDSAAVFYENAVLKNPEGALFLTALGKYKLYKKDLTAATELFNRAIKINKKDPLIYAAIAKACIDYPNIDAALAETYVAKGMELNNQLSALHLIKGDIAMLKNEFSAAASSYDRAIFYDNTSLSAYRKLGSILTLARNYKDALKYFKTSVEAKPEQILVYKSMGDLYYSFGKYAEAEASYNTYLQRAEFTIADKERYALILFFNKKYNEALKELNIILASDKNNPIMYRISGYIAYETGDFSDGVEYMKKFFAMHDQSKIIASDYAYYGKLLVKSNQDSLGIIYLSKAIEADSTKMDIVEELAKTYVKTKQHEQAIDTYGIYLNGGGDKVTANFAIGREYYYLASANKQLFDSLSVSKPDILPADSLQVYNQRAMSYFTSAQSSFQVVSELNPTYYGGFIWLARVLTNLDPESTQGLAKEPYEKALALLLSGDASKNKKSIIECYKYLGSYYYLKSEEINKSLPDEATNYQKQALENFQRVAELDSADFQAKLVITELSKKTK